MAAIDTSLAVPVDTVFPGTLVDEATIAAELAPLSRDAALMWCARINNIVSGFGPESDLERQQRAVDLFCTPKVLPALNQFAAQHGACRVNMFFRGQMLELARHVALHCASSIDDADPANNLVVAAPLFKSALIASGLWEQRLFGANSIPCSDDPAEQRRKLLGAFRRNVEGTNRTPDPGAIIARGWHLFIQNLPARLPQFAELFRSATGLTLEQYFVCSYILLSRTFSNAVPFFSSTNYIACETPFREVFARFVRLQSQTPAEWAKSFTATGHTGHQALRRQPLWSVPGGRSVISDPTFFLDNIAPAPLFRVIASRPAGFSSNQIFGAFGLAFEDYATALLKRRYPVGTGLLAQRLRCGCKGHTRDGKEFEIDALLNDVTAAVVFEMKAAWLREDTIVSADPNEFLADVRKKYGYEPTSSERGKGVAQLARTVGALARREWLGPHDECAAVKELYPVLTVYDARMATPGSACVLDDDFRALLGPVPPGIYVHPLIITTIDNLEHLVFSVEHLSLRELLHQYSLTDPKRLSSLHDFIAHSEFSEQMGANPALVELADTLSQMARAEMLGGS